MIVIAFGLKSAKIEDLLRYMFAYQITYVMYKLIKEEDKS
jgi:hypothetical protein